MVNYDFCGWATKANIKCADGRTIMKDAFIGNDGQTVPLVWGHMHDDPLVVLGHAILENKEEGVFAYGVFNDTEAGKAAKELVRHGDVNSLSIYANKLQQNGGNVIHGVIREVSLVLAGANEGAKIVDVDLSHSDDELGYVFAAMIYNDEVIEHSDDKKEEEETMAEEAKKTEESKEEKKETTKDPKEIYDSLTDEQKELVEGLVALALNEKPEEEDKEVKHNLFDQETEETNVISHSDMMAVIADAKRYGSMKESALQHGIEDIEYLIPEAKTLNATPEFVKRDTGWVSVVMNGVHKTPFSRIKSIFADITEDDARALGYLPDHTHRDAKGNLVDAEGNPAYKKEEVFSLIKRTTTPTTIYKKQKIDRDDIVDIVDFDMIAWIKAEMRVMLDEEIARAILVSDGRSASSDDKINEQNIRPIWKDEDFYTIKHTVEVLTTDDDEKIAKQVIKGAVKGRKRYKGSGNPILFTTEDMLINMLLIEDKNERRIYNNETDLAAAMRVSRIVTVPVMEGLTRTSGVDTLELAGIIVNLNDYNLGADKGGAINMFDDFDIDYNAQKYLMETRCSGALVKPYSAIALEIKKSASLAG